MYGDGMEIPSYGIYADKDWPNPEKGFAAMVTLMDADVGRLFDLLAIFFARNERVDEMGHSRAE